MWNHERPQMVKAILSKYKAKGITFPNFKTYYKAIAIKNIWYWYKKRYRPMEKNKEF